MNCKITVSAVAISVILCSCVFAQEYEITLGGEKFEAKNGQVERIETAPPMTEDGFIYASTSAPVMPFTLEDTAPLDGVLECKDGLCPLVNPNNAQTAVGNVGGSSGLCSRCVSQNGNMCGQMMNGCGNYSACSSMQYCGNSYSCGNYNACGSMQSCGSGYNQGSYNCGSMMSGSCGSTCDNYGITYDPRMGYGMFGGMGVPQLRPPGRGNRMHNIGVLVAAKHTPYGMWALAQQPCGPRVIARGALLRYAGDAGLAFLGGGMGGLLIPRPNINVSSVANARATAGAYSGRGMRMRMPMGMGMGMGD